MKKGEAQDAVAVVGMAGRFPGAESLDEFWDLLADGRDAIGPAPLDRPFLWAIDGEDPAPGGFLARPVDDFDADFFGMNPREAAFADPQQRLFLEVAWEAIEDAGLRPSTLAGSRCGVFAGVSNTDHLAIIEHRRYLGPYAASGGSAAFVGNRLSYHLDLRGPSLVIDATCASSLAAVHAACCSLRAGECDLAIAGGVNLMLWAGTTDRVAQAVGLSPGAACRPFDERADGIVRGEGCGVVVLKRGADAREQRDRPRAHILGSAVNQDGRTNGITAPSVDAQVAVMRAALAEAGVAPGAVTYVEAHGTGTRLGDPIEFEALREVYGASPGDGSHSRACALGTLKANIGHLEAAAGVAGLIKAILCLERRTLVRNRSPECPNAAIRCEETGLEFARTGREWQPSAGPRIAGVSAFSLGGTNAHLIVREAVSTPEPVVAPPRPAMVLALSARSTDALRELAARHAVALSAANGPAVGLAGWCRAAALRRDHHHERLAVTGRSGDEIVRGLRSYLDGRHDASVAAASGRVARPLLAFVFPGLGHPGYDPPPQLLAEEPTFRATHERVLARAVELRGRGDGIVDDPSNGSGGDNPVRLFALQLAIAALVRGWGVEPDFCLGQSLGEVAGAVIAGAIGEDEALAIVLEIEKLSGRHGGIVQVELSRDDAARTIAACDGALWIAGSNGPTSTLISGERAAIRLCCARLKDRGVAHWPLDIEEAYHTPMIRDREGPFLDALTRLRPRTAERLIYSSVSGGRVRGESLGALHWWRCVSQPAWFGDAARGAIEDGAGVFLELSPHPALVRPIADMIRLDGRDGQAISTLAYEADANLCLARAIGSLHSLQVPVDWGRFLGEEARRVALPSYPWQRRRHALVDQPGNPRRRRRLVGQGPRASAYRVVWRPAEEDGPPAPASEAGIGASSHDQGLERHDRLMTALTPLCSRIASWALTQLGRWDDQACLDSEGTAESLGVVAARRRAFGRILTLARSSSRDRSFPEAELDDLVRELDDDRPLIEILRRCGRKLPDILAGRLNPLEPLIWDDDGTAIAQLYARASMPRALNVMAGDWLADRLASRKDPRPIEVLEIGAGTGATSEALLGRVDPARLRYAFTDVSPFFLGRLRARFGALEGATFRMFDIDRPIEDQDIPVGTFDLIVAAHVLHVARDLEGALRRVGSLLRPGGEMLILELTRPEPWVDLTFGLTDGWWNFSDGRESRSTPTLELQEWRRTLQSLGRGFATLPARSAGLEGEPQTGGVVIISGVGRPSRLEGPAWIVSGRSDDLAGLIHAELLHRGLPSRLAAPGAGSTMGPGFAVHVIDPRVDAQADMDADVPGRLRSVTRQALEWVQGVARSEGPAPNRLWLVTRGAVATHLDDAPVDPAQSAVWGLAAVAENELASRWGGVIDADHGEPRQVAEAVVDELLGESSEKRVCLRGGRRLVARLSRVELPRTRKCLGYRGAYLVTGGCGGIGRLVSTHLARRGAESVVILGRRGEQHPAAARVARAVRAAGASVRFVAADLGDATRVADVIGDLESGPIPLRGVFHLAGVFEDRTIAREEWSRFERVFRAKVDGAWNLHRATIDLELDAFVLFSSATTLLGLPGLGNYTAANAFLDALAAYRRSCGLPGNSLAWGGWRRRGMAWRAGARARRRWSALGLRGLRAREGLDWIDRVLQTRSETATLGILDVDWARWIDNAPGGRVAPFLAEVSGESGVDLERPEAARDGSPPPVSPQDVAPMVESAVRASLGLDSRFAIDPHLPLGSLGVDSLVAVELRNNLSRRLGRALPVSFFFDHPTLNQLILALIPDETVAGRPGATEPVASPVVDLHRLAELLGRVESMSEQEAEAFLSRRPTWNGSDHGGRP